MRVHQRPWPTPPVVLHVNADENPVAAEVAASAATRLQGVTFASQRNVDDLGFEAPRNRWTQSISAWRIPPNPATGQRGVLKTPHQLADEVSRALARRGDRPRAGRVVIDELTARTANVIGGAARLLAQRPKLDGKWGVYLVNPAGVGNNEKLERSVFPHLRNARAFTVLEAYPNFNARGFDLQQFFTRTRNNLRELEREGLRPSASLGVLDRYLGGGNEGTRNLRRLLEGAERYLPEWVNAGRIGAWNFSGSEALDRVRTFVRFLERDHPRRNAVRV